MQILVGLHWVWTLCTSFPIRQGKFWGPGIIERRRMSRTGLRTEAWSIMRCWDIMTLFVMVRAFLSMPVRLRSIFSRQGTSLCSYSEGEKPFFSSRFCPRLLPPSYYQICLIDAKFCFRAIENMHFTVLLQSWIWVLCAQFLLVRGYQETRSDFLFFLLFPALMYACNLNTCTRFQGNSKTTSGSESEESVTTKMAMHNLFLRFFVSGFWTCDDGQCVSKWQVALRVHRSRHSENAISGSVGYRERLAVDSMRVPTMCSSICTEFHPRDRNLSHPLPTSQTASRFFFFFFSAAHEQKKESCAAAFSFEYITSSQKSQSRTP